MSEYSSGEIKSLETPYKGYRFRSRLEARWAVFLDTFGVPYEYEYQGYDLGEHGWYLPDFWLFREEAFVEIKPQTEWHYNPKYEKLSEVGHKVLHVAGNPYPNEYIIAGYEGGRCWGSDPSDPMVFAESRRVPGELWVATESRQVCLKPLSREDRDYNRPPLIDTPALMYAYQAARRARF